MKNSSVRATTKQNIEERIATVRRQRILLGILIGILLLYLIVAIYFAFHFQPNTVINGVDVSGLTLKAAGEKLKSVADDYSLLIREPGGTEAVIVGDALSLRVVDASNAKQCLSAQNKLGWIASIFSEKTYQVDIRMDYDHDALGRKMDTLSILDESDMTQCADAYLTQQEDGSYVIIPEVIGSTLRIDAARSMIEDAVANARPELDLSPAMQLPEVYSDDENLNTRLSEWNAYLASTGLTYQVGDTEEVFTGPVIASLLSDDGEHVTLSYTKTADLMAKWKEAHDTYKCVFDFNTSTGKTLPIEPYGNYGFELDEEGTCADVMEKINAHDKGKYDAKYFHKALYDTNKGLGGNYVEININRQHLWVYKDGECVVDTDIVSGLPVSGRVTYYGCYAIRDKAENATLGDLEVEGYETTVRYWVPFNNGEGIHDASWRENFGGKIWLTYGSHGCVNVPEWVMEDIYDNVEIGEPVVVYGTAYDEKVNDPSNKTVDEDYYYREFYGE